MTGPEIQAEIDRGAKFVCYQYVICALLITIRRNSPIKFVRADESAILKGLPYCGLTLLTGWWGLWGLIYTPVVLYKNLRGGTDLTERILERINQGRPKPDVLGMFPESGGKAQETGS